MFYTPTLILGLFIAILVVTMFYNNKKGRSQEKQRLVELCDYLCKANNDETSRKEFRDFINKNKSTSLVDVHMKMLDIISRG